MAIPTMSVAEWIDANYRPDRLRREEGTRERIIADRLNNMRETGEACISKHDAIHRIPAWLIVQPVKGAMREWVEAETRNPDNTGYIYTIWNGE